MELKNFVDFAYSMVNMDEVKDGVFKTPKEMIFELDRKNHEIVHKKIKKEKGDLNFENLEQEFNVDIFGINFKFICEK
jgi:hypothetical protein